MSAMTQATPDDACVMARPTKLEAAQSQNPPSSAISPTAFRPEGFSIAR
jgi:hypothetical protein